MVCNRRLETLTGIIGTLALIAVIICSVMLPDLIQDNKLERYLGETTGTVMDITENTKIDQGLGGTRIYVGSYTVNYYYLVNEETYTGTERVKATPNATRALNNIAKSKPSQLVVRYDEFNPSKSTILVE